MKSLRDQLLKAGLTDEKTVKNLRKQKHQQNKKPKKARGAASEIARKAEQTQRDKANRDKELNRLRQLEIENRAGAAQIQQLIDTSKIDRTQGEVIYHYTMDAKVKSILVTAEQHKQLARKQIAIAICSDNQVELVPGVVAEKIAQRDNSRIIENKSEAPAGSQEDDPYASYQIPDDLVW